MARSGSHHRQDITGLRAIAVLSVFAFHLDWTVTSGGFVGVDVFFVISGYVISRLIASEVLLTGAFDFSHFYLRRLRRLYPSLLATLTLTFAFGALILSPADLVHLADATFATVFVMSNVYFWDRVDYFDQFANLSPLLHTWTLAVEEQFYLVWPLVILLLFRLHYRGIRAAIGAVIIIGLAANFVATRTFIDSLSPGTWLHDLLDEKGSATIFFLTPFRIFEFAIGALVLWLPAIDRQWLAEACTVLGLAAIGTAVVLFDGTMLFPAHNALLPCVGAALVIYGGENARTAAILRSRPFVKIGDLSYVLYLVHWPAIVLVDYYWFDLPQTERVAIIAVAAGIATLGIHYFVERPFRYPASGDEKFAGRFSHATLTAIVILALPLVSAQSSGGWPSRVPEAIRNIVATEKQQADETVQFFLNTARAAYDGRFADDQRRRVLIVGDSMANDLALSFYVSPGWQDRADIEVLNISHTCQLMIGDRRNLAGYQFEEARIAPCEKSLDAIFASPLLAQADAVIITHNWYDWIADDGVVAAIERIENASDAEIFIFGKRRWFKEHLTQQILRRGTFSQAGKDAYRSLMNETKINARIRQIAARTGATFLDWDGLRCDIAEETCPAVRGSDLLYRDQVHFTLAGARVFGERFLEREPFKDIIFGD